MPFFEYRSAERLSQAVQAFDELFVFIDPARGQEEPEAVDRRLDHAAWDLEVGHRPLPRVVADEGVPDLAGGHFYRYMIAVLTDYIDATKPVMDNKAVEIFREENIAAATKYKYAVIPVNR